MSVPAILIVTRIFNLHQKDPHQHHGVWTHRQLDCFKQLIQANSTKYQIPVLRTLVKGIRRRPKYACVVTTEFPLVRYAMTHDHNSKWLSSIGRDTIIFYACTMGVWHISSYFVIRTRLKDDIWPHLTLFRLFCDPDRGQDDIWPHLTQFNTSRDRGQVENCAIESCLTSLTHLKRHEW